MCKEDIRIARRAYVGDGTTSNLAQGAGSAMLIKANPRRFSLQVAFMPESPTDTGNFILVYAKGANGLVVPLCVLTNDHPSFNCSLLDVGQLVTEEFWTTESAATQNPIKYVGETEFLEEI